MMTYTVDRYNVDFDGGYDIVNNLDDVLNDCKSVNYEVIHSIVIWCKMPSV